MAKIAVLGGTGMAGHVAAAYLREHGHDVFVTSRSAENTSRSRAIDAADFGALGSWLDEAAPDAVVNCIGVLQKEADARPDTAVLLNAYLPHFLARKLAGSRARLIHISTDCVFSGSRGGYLEDDLPDGRTMYDRSKALGEVVNGKDLTFRMSIVGPDRHENGTGLFNWFMKQSGEIRGFRRAIWSGVTTIELARAICAALEQNLTGLYQLCPPPIDKHSLLLLFQKAFGKRDLTIRPDDGFSADKSLINTRTDFKFELKDYPAQVADMRDWVAAHAAFYPHYGSSAKPLQRGL